MTPAPTVAELWTECARLRSIIHRAEAAILSYQTRDAIRILGELNANEDSEDDG